jgi:hypothetical protein
MWSAWFWSWTFANETFWALVMTLRSIACSDVSSLGHIEIPMTHPQLQCNQENWDCLEKSGWSLGMMWVFVASAHPWDCGTDFAQIFLFCKSSWRIWRIVSLLMFNSTNIILRVNQRSHITISRTSAIVSAFWEVEGRPLLGSSWRSSQPSLNHLNHSVTLLWCKASSP